MFTFFQSFNALYAKSSDFSEPVLQRLVNVYCKPYLLYGADVVIGTILTCLVLRTHLIVLCVKCIKLNFSCWTAYMTSRINVILCKVLP